MKIYIAGHRGMVGGAVRQRLARRKHAGASPAPVVISHAKVDLTDQAAVRDGLHQDRTEPVAIVSGGLCRGLGPFLFRQSLQGGAGGRQDLQFAGTGQRRVWMQSHRTRSAGSNRLSTEASNIHGER